MKRIIFLLLALGFSQGVFSQTHNCPVTPRYVTDLFENNCESINPGFTFLMDWYVNGYGQNVYRCYVCDAGYPSSSSSSSAPSECQNGEVKNIVSGQCEPLTQCTYPQLYNSLDNSCRTNEANCAINTVPIPFSDACNVLGNPECPTGWILSDVTGSHCLPDPDAPPTSSAPNHGGSSSSNDSSSAPSEPPTSSGSTSSSGSSSGNDSGGGDGSGNGSGDGNGSGNQSSSGSGSGGGGGAGQCDPTAKNYFDCIAGPTQAYAGLGDIPQLKGFSFDETEQLLQDKKAELQTVMEDIRGEAQSLFDFNLNSGGGALTDTCLQIFNVEVCFGWSKFSEGLQLLANVIFFICAFIAFAIVIRR